MLLEFVGQSASDRDNIAANPSRLTNCYREPTVGGPFVLKSVPGMTPHARISTVFVRALMATQGSLFALAGGSLVRIGADGSLTTLGATLDSANASLSTNNGDITAVIGGKYYTWDGTVLVDPTPGAFSAFGSVEFFANYTILTEQGGRRWQWSDLADAGNLPGLNFQTADGRDDNLVRAFSIGGQLWLFKETSHEIWYNTGAAGALAFERQAGGVRDVGLLGFGLIDRFAGSAFMVGTDGRAHIINGSALQPVSTPPVETAIRQCRPQRVFVYEDEGHTFCCITFLDCPAWCFDVATNEWHERAEGPGKEPWSGQVTAKLGADWYVGRSTGEVSVFRRANSDGPVTLVREAVSRSLYNDGERFVVREVEFFPRQGFSDGRITMSVSRDGGVTWGAEKNRPLGPVGQYAKRTIWRNQGLTRVFTAKIRWTDPFDVGLSAEARVVL